MAAPRLWWLGARPRTLPAAVSPVIVGLGSAVFSSDGDWNTTNSWVLTLCVTVALALQVGVNYANDYSDGVRGTDEARVGPVRLVGQGLVAAHQVRRAAFIAFAVAAASGLTLVVITGLPSLPVGTTPAAANRTAMPVWARWQFLCSSDSLRLWEQHLR